MKHMRGFTLIELMIGVTLAAILATMAVPSFTGLIQRTRLDSQANELFSAVQYARSEALKRNANVTLCRSPNPAAAAPACGVAGDQGTWATGWIVFVDGAPLGAVGVTDAVLRTGTVANNVAFVTGVAYANFFGFSPSGRPYSGLGNGNGTLHVCNDVFRRSIVISPAGRVRRDIPGDNSDCSEGL